MVTLGCVWIKDTKQRGCVVITIVRLPATGLGNSGKCLVLLMLEDDGGGCWLIGIECAFYRNLTFLFSCSSAISLILALQISEARRW